jgi:hypothetical protein
MHPIVPDDNCIGADLACAQYRHDLRQYLFAPSPEIHGRDALVFLAGPAEAETARSGAQGAASHHRRYLLKSSVK